MAPVEGRTVERAVDVDETREWCVAVAATSNGVEHAFAAGFGDEKDRADAPSRLPLKVYTEPLHLAARTAWERSLKFRRSAP